MAAGATSSSLSSDRCLLTVFLRQVLAEGVSACKEDTHVALLLRLFPTAGTRLSQRDLPHTKH